MVFDPDASAYTFTLGESLHVLGRAGIMNNSGHLQNFVNTASCDVGFPGASTFTETPRPAVKLSSPMTEGTVNWGAASLFFLVTPSLARQCS